MDGEAGMKSCGALNMTARSRIYQELWDTLAQRYGLFDVKDVDWHRLGESYWNRALSVETDAELFDRLVELLSPLQDKHVWLIGDERAWNCRMESACGLAHVSEAVAAWKAPFSERLVVTKYVCNATKFADEIIGGLLQPTLGYLRISAFPDDVGAVGAAIDRALQAFIDVEALVIDVRDNQGGSDRGAKAVADRFADRQRLFMTATVRTGDGEEEFASPVEWWVEPEGPRQFLNPVFLLVNPDTFSAGETFTLAMHVLPHVTSVGEPTAGAFSDATELILGNGWVLIYSIGV
jgi:carboxyl-terminal processing protease